MQRLRLNIKLCTCCTVNGCFKYNNLLKKFHPFSINNYGCVQRNGLILLHIYFVALKFTPVLDVVSIRTVIVSNGLFGIHDFRFGSSVIFFQYLNRMVNRNERLS